MTAEELKKSILQQAIQGKLVPQNPDDEPASTLLDRIRVEKSRLVAEGKIKRDKNESVIFRTDDGRYIERNGKIEKDISEEIPFEIPYSWEWVRFGKLSFNYDYQRVPLSVVERSKLAKIFNYYGASGIIDKVDSFLFDRPLLLIGEDGANLINRSTPIAFIAKGKFWVNNHAHVLDYYNHTLMEYVCIFINAISLTDYVTGTAQPKMNQEKMNSIMVALPPQAEQKRIVEKIEELMPLVEEYGKAQSRLDELNSSLGDNLRKSVLQYAIQGKLVHQNSEDEPTSVLLNHIRNEKARLISEGKIKRDKNESVIYRTNNGRYIELMGKAETDITDKIPFEIPDSWEWVRVKTVGLCETGTTPSKGHPEYFGDYIPFLGPANIQNNQIISVTQGLSVEGSKFGRIVPKDTILQVCIGGSIGKCAIVDKEVTFNQQINSVTPIIANVKYLFACLQSDSFFQQIKMKSTGTATPIINRGNWELLLIPLPPLAEQKRIVERLEYIFSLCK